MNNIDELVEIIRDSGGYASVDTITDIYCKKHHMIKHAGYKETIRETLINNKGNDLTYDAAECVWYLKKEKSITASKRVEIITGNEKQEVIFSSSTNMEGDKNSDKILLLLRDIFAKGSPISSDTNKGNVYYFAQGNKWRVEFRPYRLTANCAYKAKIGRSVIFEITPRTNKLTI